MTTTRPSAIHPDTIAASTFGRAEMELAAMCVVNYLSSTENTWDSEFRWRDFVEWVSTRLNICELYKSMLQIYGGWNFILAGIDALVEERHLKQYDRDGATYFRVEESFVETMKRFAMPE